MGGEISRKFTFRFNLHTFFVNGLRYRIALHEPRLVRERQRWSFITQDLWRGKRGPFARVVSSLVPSTAGGHKALKLRRLRRTIVVELPERQRVYLFIRNPAEILEE